MRRLLPLALSWFVCLANAQSYPARPVKLPRTVSYPAKPKNLRMKPIRSVSALR